MLVELVKTATADGVRLDGALALPNVSPPAAARADAILCLHGAGGNFYSSSLFEEIGRQATESGIAVLRVNTRGATALSLSATREGKRNQGAAYEIVADCVHDIAAWLELLGKRGFARVALVGHSLGAVKSLYTQAHGPSSSVTAIAALSPPRLSYLAFRNAMSSGFFDCIARAEELVAKGEGETLMEVRFPLPLLISAAGYVDKYGKAERYNYFRFLEQVRQPTMFVFGSEELAAGLIPFAGAPEEIARVPAHGPRRVEIVAGADHFYRGVEEDGAAVVREWLISGK